MVTSPKKNSINSTLWYMNDNNGNNSHKIIIIITLVTTAASIISITSNKFHGILNSVWRQIMFPTWFSNIQNVFGIFIGVPSFIA